MQVIKPYFGKFQPNLYLLVEHPEDTPININIENMHKQDILKDFKAIDDNLKYAPLLISGTVRFSIRGDFSGEFCSRTGNHLKDKFEINPRGNHLLTCVWWKEQQKGIDDYTSCAIYWHRAESSAKTSGYDYIITEI